MSCDVFLQQHKQEVEAEQSMATALRRQLEEVQQAQQDAAQVNFVMATFLLAASQAPTAHHVRLFLLPAC